MSYPIVFEGKPDVQREDGGASLQLDVGEDDSEVFAALMSSDENRRHEVLTPLIGKRLRVTIEVLDDDQQ